MLLPSHLRPSLLVVAALLPAAAIAESDPGFCLDAEIELIEGAACLSFNASTSTTLALDAPGVRLDGMNTCTVSCTITLANVDYAPNDDRAQPEADEVYRRDSLQVAAGEEFSLEVYINTNARLTDGQTATVDWDLVCGAGASDAVDETLRTRVDYALTQCDDFGGGDAGDRSDAGDTGDISDTGDSGDTGGDRGDGDASSGHGGDGSDDNAGCSAAPSGRVPLWPLALATVMLGCRVRPIRSMQADRTSASHTR